MAKPRPRAVRTLAPQPAPVGIYASSYDPDLAVWICERLAEGVSLSSLCRDQTAMPTEKTVWNWRRAHPDFDAAYVTAVSFARAERRARRRAEAAARAAERRARAMRTKGQRSGRTGGRSLYTPALAEAVLDRVAEGEPVWRICRAPGMPSQGTFYAWLRDRPDFLVRYRRAKEAAFMLVMEEAMAAAPWMGTYGASMLALRRAEKAALRRCGWLAPRGMAEGVYGRQR